MAGSTADPRTDCVEERPQLLDLSHMLLDTANLEPRDAALVIAARFALPILVKPV